MARPGYHDPLHEFGGAPPAISALTLRAILAVFGFFTCIGLAFAAAQAGVTPMAVLLVLLAVIAAIDLAVIVRRKRRGEPG